MFSVSVNFSRFLADIKALEQRQVPYAVSLALNATIDDVERNTQKSMTRRLDRPTPFTMRGLAKWKANKRKLRASVFFKDAQAGYLEKQETGGIRRPKGRAIPVPVGQRVNKYGNMPKGAIKRLLARKDVFSRKINGVAGIWQRPKGRRKTLKLLVAYQPKATYQPRLGYRAGALKTTQARIGVHFRRSMSQALKTARR
ncbi:hypothetical protein [Roseibium polysiphoniae]|uniref:Uncharacterized protein n=1 Tax=Roseibium polysiphoniae TaxID=2571221 RepID=A0ABR9C6C2_9HYPH|nr:hypothetical protein [Roseibium polysiphoniae]MBD8875425.1 hypothetical protein [Roseibium polysiphoniae]